MLGPDPEPRCILHPLLGPLDDAVGVELAKGGFRGPSLDSSCFALSPAEGAVKGKTDRDWSPGFVLAVSPRLAGQRLASPSALVHKRRMKGALLLRNSKKCSAR